MDGKERKLKSDWFTKKYGQYKTDLPDWYSVKLGTNKHMETDWYSKKYGTPERQKPDSISLTQDADGHERFPDWYNAKRKTKKPVETDSTKCETRQKQKSDSDTDEKQKPDSDTGKKKKSNPNTGKNQKSNSDTGEKLKSGSISKTSESHGKQSGDWFARKHGEFQMDLPGWSCEVSAERFKSIEERYAERFGGKKT